MKNLQVSSKYCSQCLFSDRKIVSDERKAEVLAACDEKNAHFTCHKATGAGQDVCCRGFYEERGSTYTNLARYFGFVDFVDVERLERVERDDPSDYEDEES